MGVIHPGAVGGTGPFTAERYTYDADGELILTESGYLSSWQSDAVLPANWTGFTLVKASSVAYDTVGNKISETVKSPSAPVTVRQYSYDPEDRLLCTAVRMNPAIFASLPADACSLGTQGTGANAFGADRISKNIYDPAGQLIQVRQAVGTSLEEAYATYVFSNNGKQVDIIDAAGSRAHYVYDGFDRLSQCIAPVPVPDGL